MLKTWLPYFHETPESRAGSGGATGTTDNGAAEVSGASSSGGYVASESAIDAMIKAASSFSSEETPATGGEAGTVAKPAGAAGDTTAAGATPQTGASGQPQTGAAGQAPENRIQAAVRNARTDERTKVEQQYEWARSIPENRRADVPVGIEMLDEIRRDPVAFVTQLASELQARGHQLNFGGGQTQAEAAAVTGDFKIPKGNLVAEDGRRAHSEEQLGEIVEGLTRHILSQVDTRLKPAQTFVQGEQRRQEQTQLHEEARGKREALMSKMRALPHFTPENEGRILEIARAVSQEDRALLGPAGLIHHAYTTFVNNEVLPKQRLMSEEEVRKENAKKAATSIGQQRVNGSTTGAKVADIKGVPSLAAHMEKLASTDLSDRF